VQTVFVRRLSPCSPDSTGIGLFNFPEADFWITSQNRSPAVPGKHDFKVARDSGRIRLLIVLAGCRRSSVYAKAILQQLTDLSCALLPVGRQLFRNLVFHFPEQFPTSARGDRKDEGKDIPCPLNHECVA
jgi:hypothetical protein